MAGSSGEVCIYFINTESWFISWPTRGPSDWPAKEEEIWECGEWRREPPAWRLWVSEDRKRGSARRGENGVPEDMGKDHRLLSKNYQSLWRGNKKACHQVIHTKILLTMCILSEKFWGYNTWLPIDRASQVALLVNNLSFNSGDIRDASSIPGSGRSSGWGHGNPIQCSWLENPMESSILLPLLPRVLCAV